MENPFKASNQGEMNIKRNAYDLSKSSLYTTEWGRLDPIYLHEVIPGETVKLDSSIAIQGMPTVFPLQTRCRVSVEYYYCRNRCVQKNFEDFIFRTKDVEAPYVLPSTSENKKKMFKTGSLSDFFGFPTTIGSSTGSVTRTFYSGLTPYVVGKRPYETSQTTASRIIEIFDLVYHQDAPSDLKFGSAVIMKLNKFEEGYSLTSSSRISFGLVSPHNSAFSTNDTFVSILDTKTDSILYTQKIGFSLNNDFSVFNQSVAFDDKFLEIFNSRPTSCRLIVGRSYIYLYNGVYHLAYKASDNVFISADPITSSSTVTGDWSSYSISNLHYDRILDATDDSVLAYHPVVGLNPTMKVNAWPYRHYEMVCNYYHRNDKNNPYYLNGEPQYNQFIPTDGDGLDTNLYDFHYHNWEEDRFTSAVQSPQFGAAPLVGVLYNGVSDSADLVFTAEVNGEEKQVHAIVGIDENGQIENIMNFDKEIPSANLHQLQQQINAGISINDFRVTNSFQRFLENTLRRGLRYRNQMKSHHGVSVDYPDIDIPQYIGGYSGELSVSKVTNTADSPNAGLGDFVGQLYGQISSKHTITHYCAEHGYILGIASIVPIPVYSQSANKSLIKTDPFDFFLPEFSKVGFMPVHYSEVMPLQTTGNQSVDDVFGYQKAWYEYMRDYDESHGDFRTSLRDFVLQRTFANRPTLVEDFVKVKPDQLNDVFVTQNIADAYGSAAKFMCNIYHHVISNNTVPKFGTPSLE